MLHVPVIQRRARSTRRHSLSRLLLPLVAALVGLGGVVPVATGASAATKRPAATKAVFPTVTGAFGVKPKITFPKTAAPGKLEMEVLHRGTGPAVKKGELLVCNYYGQIWRGKVFDTSFGRALFGRPIGEGQLIPGWDKDLVGARVGSRILLVIPPAEGYGKAGNTGAGITGTDTLVFVIDVVAGYNTSVHGDPHATVLRSEANGIKVGGKLGGQPTVTITKGAPEPKKVSIVLIARGHGPKITPGLIIDQYVVAAWSGQAPLSSWAAGSPDAETVGIKAEPTLLDPVVGMPLGSRVLVELPATSQTGGPYALAVDLVAEPKNPAAA